MATQPELIQLARLGVRLSGVLIRGVEPGGAGDQAGLRGAPFSRDPDGRYLLGDIILKVGDAATPDPNALRDALESHEIGETVTLTVQRGQEQLEVPVKLQALEQ